MESMGWMLGKELGSGHFAKVKLVTRRSDGQQAACKIIKKPKGAANPLGYNRECAPSGPRCLDSCAELKKRALVANEHKILTEIDDPYVVKCYDAFETDDKLYLFMELMDGGELFDRIVEMGHFTEAMAQDVTFKLLTSLEYMHGKGIAHRDLKPENMLMSSKEVRRHAGVPGSVQTSPPPSRPPSVECPWLEPCAVACSLRRRTRLSRLPTLASPNSLTSSRPS